MAESPVVVYEAPLSPEDNTPQTPQSREAEGAVLGSVLISPDEAYFAASVELPKGAEEFFIHRHGFIWQAIADLKNDGEAVDLITLSNKLESRGLLGEVGGSAYITGLITLYPSSLKA